MAGASGWTYRDAGDAAGWAQSLLRADAALAAVAVALALMRGLDPDAAGDAEMAVGLGQLVVYLAGGVLALRWLYLANANARALGADDMMGSPGWAVGWFFVPLANLVMPYMTVRDMWKASARPKDWQAAPAPAAIGLWWACWLAAGISGIVAFRLWLEYPKEAGDAAETLFLASNASSIPATLLLAWIIGRIQAMQAAARPAGAA